MAIPRFPAFEIGAEQSSVGTRWEKWLNRFENFLMAFNITNPQRKRALLLYNAGEPVQDIFETLSDTGNVEDYDVAKLKLTEHFQPQKNREYEVYMFRQTEQQQGETLDSFCSRLRQKGRNCEFHDLESEIKSQIVQGCLSKRLRRRVLRESSMTLTDVLKLGRSLELSDVQAKSIEQPQTSHVTSTEEREVNAVAKRNFRGKSKRPQDSTKTQDRSAEAKLCRGCGNNYPHPGGKEKCPAWGKVCR
jgi:hypothetical protein